MGRGGGCSSFTEVQNCGVIDYILINTSGLLAVHIIIGDLLSSSTNWLLSYGKSVFLCMYLDPDIGELLYSVPLVFKNTI